MRKAKSPLAGKKADVCVTRNGASISLGNVNATEAPAILAELLKQFRAMTQRNPELINDLGTIGGGSPIEVVDDDWADDSRKPKRLGFRP